MYFPDVLPTAGFSAEAASTYPSPVTHPQIIQRNPAPYPQHLKNSWSNYFHTWTVTNKVAMNVPVYVFD